MSARRERADVLLVERELCPTRARAQALIMAGRVFSGEIRIEKAGSLVAKDAPLVVRGDDNPYVSRGGLKLQGALDAFIPHGLDPAGKVALDVGASTGGFTDCLLMRGATRVYAVDVGWGQLHEKLRVDPRVVVRERENARELDRASFPEPIALVVVDASFIGIGSLMPAIARVLDVGGELCAMVKPQFEVGRDEAKRSRGVIKDEGIRSAAIESATAAIESAGFDVIASVDSTLPGPKGNVERFVYARRRAST
jgi:23S rRNA (cytidine1920-2'-O)/16S rRNA (cytidine1409-2'-O)-methyltransferase